MTVLENMLLKKTSGKQAPVVQNSATGVTPFAAIFCQAGKSQEISKRRKSP